MDNLQELIEKYSEEENIPGLDDLNNRLSVTGSEEEKELLGDAYVSNFAQCHYDFHCGKFNEPDMIHCLFDWLDKIKVLVPLFDEYHTYKAQVFTMLSSVSKEESEKIKYLNLSIENTKLQLELTGRSSDLLVQMADSLFELCQVEKVFKKETMNKIKGLFSEAVHLERKKEHQTNFFGFNGTAISSFLNCSYEILALDLAEKQSFFDDYKKTYRETLNSYREIDPHVYYYWTDTLLHITDWVNYPKMSKSGISQDVVDQIWIEIKEVSHFITALESKSEHFLTSIGHMFTNIARKETSLEHYQVAFDYYVKALEINDGTWSKPYYAANALQMMALIQLEKGDKDKATGLFEQGLSIFDAAQKKVDDFHLSVYHGEYLYDYAKFIEKFSNKETLVEARKRFDESRVHGKNFHTSPFYGLAKVALRLEGKKECLNVLTTTGEIFSSEFHTHDFNEIIEDSDFEEIHRNIPEIMKKVSKLK